MQYIAVTRQLLQMCTVKKRPWLLFEFCSFSHNSTVVMLHIGLQ